jgi:hypothetical protein
MSKREQPKPPIDPDLRGRANVTQEKLRELGAACREYSVSEKARFTLARMAAYPPPIRLAVNLKTLIGLLVKGERPKYDVLTDGLLPDEHAALVELDMKGLPAQLREIAHGLFNVHERWHLMRELRRLFKDSFEAKEEFISPKVEEDDGTEP